jgi:hypothetical protein
MAASLNCGFTRYGLPDTCKKGNPFAMMAGAYFVAHGTSFTVAQAADIDNYITKVIAKTLLPVHNVFSVENTSTEKSVTTSPTGRKKKNSDGFRGYKLSFDFTADQHKTFKDWEGADMDIIPYDQNGILKFTCPDGTNLKGFQIDYFDVEKKAVVTESGSELTVVEIQEADASEWDSDGYWLRPQDTTALADRWKPSDVKTISLAIVTSTSVTSHACTLTIKIPTSEMKDGAIVYKMVTGAAKENIKLYRAGVEITDHTLTAGATSGTYALAQSALAAGDVLYFAPQATDEKLFESASITLV